MAGDAYEIYGDLKRDQPSKDRNMDEWNNAVGRNIGKNSSTRDEIAERVYEALNNGELITDPSTDIREYPPPAGGEASDLAEEGCNGSSQLYRYYSRGWYYYDHVNGGTVIPIPDRWHRADSPDALGKVLWLG